MTDFVTQEEGDGELGRRMRKHEVEAFGRRSRLLEYGTGKECYPLRSNNKPDGGWERRCRKVLTLGSLL